MEPMHITIELFIGNTKIQSQELQLPHQMMIMQCQDIVNQVAQDQRPMKIEMIGTKTVELPDNKFIEKPSRLIYANNKYIENFPIGFTKENN